MEEMPKLTKCTLLTAFKCVESVRMKNAGRLEEMKVLVNAKKEEEEEEEEEEEWELPELPEPPLEPLVSLETPEPVMEQPVILTSENPWDRMDRTIEVMNVSYNSCNERELTELDLSGFVNLRKIKVGKECFMFVNEVKIIGLSELERVAIGRNSFTQHKNDVENDPNRHFYLKNCPKLKSLKMGRYSFSDYSVCQIENVNALEVIEMGDLDYWSNCFYWSSLELKSILIHNE